MPANLPDDINLHESKCGWTAAVPVSRGAFFGQAVRLDIQTRSFPQESQPPVPSEPEVALASAVLEDIGRILREAEAQFTSYNAKTAPNAIFHVRDPHIWISREYIAPGTLWSFVVGLQEAPDFGYHIEFDGAACIDIWAGD